MSSVHSDSLELDDIDLIEEFLVDEPSTSSDGGRTSAPKAQSVDSTEYDITPTTAESSGSAPSLPHPPYINDNAVYGGDVLYKDEKGNLYRVVSPMMFNESLSKVDDGKANGKEAEEEQCEKDSESKEDSEIPSASAVRGSNSFHRNTHQFSTTKGHALYPLKAFYLQVGDRRLRFKSVRLSGNEKLRCDECKTAFSCRASMMRHNAAVHPELVYECPYCDRSFLQQHTLDNHKRTHMMEKRYQCHLCPKRFVKQSNFLIHTKLHATGDRNFCPECDKWFPEEEAMLSHSAHCAQRVRRMESPDLTEPEDQDQFQYASESKNWDNKPTQNAKIFPCEYCGRVFAQTQALASHIRAHRARETCTICKSQFQDGSVSLCNGRM
ncbi:hypothetical protein QR680_001291 [Steinernema hermaphroditum]|uniref:C2H2-type domain-containing protein n=1 Tax=Steinernema hermaphroditum TaxID=289476 RepID=A0AA39LFQ4_9BILA|nr:hypothetical protein QR680_001291 [Steinernema hermaphroditum]